jgi:hypothetical protein
LEKNAPPLNVDELAAKSVPDLIKLLSSLNTAASGSISGAQEESHRQAIQCLIEEKLTATHINALNQLDQSINKLNRSTTYLTVAGWVLSVVIAAASIYLTTFLKK